jgi:poly(A) polymerase
MKNTAIQICKKLQENGFEALFAGGAVRDIYLGNIPDDIDIATNASPEEIENLFTKSFAIGKHFGVILIEENGHHFEIASFRSDSGYSDGRRPDAIRFTDKREDALRRDFTINALFWDPIKNIYHDFVGGREDIRNKTLRFVGDPEIRIREDFLRILRAVRFKNRLGFSYAPKMRKCIKDHATLVSGISAERIATEMTKMILSPYRLRAFEDLSSLGIMPVIFPEISKLKNITDGTGDKNVLAHTFECLKYLPEDASSALAWATLFHDTGKGETCVRKKGRNRFPRHAEIGEKISRILCKRLAFSRFQTDKICWLCKYHITFYGALKMTFLHRMHFYDHPFFPELLQLCRCDALGSDGNASLVNKIETDYNDAHERKRLPQFQKKFLTGNEIMEITGLPPGPTIGKIQKILREQQILKTVNTKEEAKERAQKYMKKNHASSKKSPD